MNDRDAWQFNSIQYNIYFQIFSLTFINKQDFEIAIWYPYSCIFDIKGCMNYDYEYEW